MAATCFEKPSFENNAPKMTIRVSLTILIIYLSIIINFFIWKTLEVNENKYGDKYENTGTKLGEGSFAEVFKIKSIQNPIK